MEASLIHASIAIGFLLVLVIPLYILGKKSSKEKVAALLNRFDEVCALNNLSVKEKDVIGNKIFGYDTTRRTVALLFIMGENEEKHLINLNNVTKAVANKIAKGKAFEISLAYWSASGTKSEILFYRPFRDNEKDQSALQKKAEEIANWINQPINNITRPNFGHLILL